MRIKSVGVALRLKRNRFSTDPADELVSELQGQLKKLKQGLKSFDERSTDSPRAAELRGRAQAKIVEVEQALDHPRIGARADSDRLSRIAASRRQLLADFKASRPCELKTNEEILSQSRLNEAFEDSLDALVRGIRQPSVGSRIEPAI